MSVQKRRDAASSRIHAADEPPPVPGAEHARGRSARRPSRRGSRRRARASASQSAARSRRAPCPRPRRRRRRRARCSSSAPSAVALALAADERPRSPRSAAARRATPPRAMMWRMSAIIASCGTPPRRSAPACPSARAPRRARIATKSVAVHDRTAKVEHGERGAGDRRDEPGAADLGLDEVAAELRAELGPGADHGVERVDEGEESGRGGGDREDGRRDGCDVQRECRTRARPLQGEQRGDEHPDHAGGREVDERASPSGAPTARTGRDRRSRAARRRRRTPAPTTITASAATTRIAGPAARSARGFTAQA